MTRKERAEALCRLLLEGSKDSSQYCFLKHAVMGNPCQPDVHLVNALCSSWMREAWDRLLFGGTYRDYGNIRCHALQIAERMLAVAMFADELKDASVEERRKFWGEQ